MTEVPVLLHATMEDVAVKYLGQDMPAVVLESAGSQKKVTLEDLYDVRYRI